MAEGTHGLEIAKKDQTFKFGITALLLLVYPGT